MTVVIPIDGSVGFCINPLWLSAPLVQPNLAAMMIDMPKCDAKIQRRVLGFVRQSHLNLHTITRGARTSEIGRNYCWDLCPLLSCRLPGNVRSWSCPSLRENVFIFPRLHSNSCGVFGARLTALVRQTYGPAIWRLAEMTSRSRMSEYSEVCVLRASLKGPKNETGAVEPYFVGSTSMATASFTQEYTALLMTSTFAVCTGGRFCVRDETIIPRRSYRSISESDYFWCFSSSLKD